jgi:hypothetical protein
MNRVQRAIGAVRAREVRDGKFDVVLVLAHDHGARLRLCRPSRKGMVSPQAALVTSGR